MRRAPSAVGGVTAVADLICPACAAPLERSHDDLSCGGCERRYPVLWGIPDLRLRSDSYLTLDADRAKAAELAGLDGEDFAGLVRAYWARTPEVPPSLARRYTDTVLDGERRAAETLRALGVELAGRTLLDVGTGTGGMLAAAASRGAVPAGVDIALRWLVIAKRRLRESGIDAVLVAADGAALPFRAGSFDVTTCIETLEHADDQAGMLRSCLASVRPGGRSLVVTANRLSLAPDPVFRLWGVGYLPRRVATAYVARRRHTRYQHYRPISARAVRGAIGRRSGVSVAAGPVPVPAGAGPARRLAQAAYDRLRRGRLGAPMALVAPFLEVTATPNGSHPGATAATGSTRSIDQEA
jgi:ubiquinone/menaquinone biosynthesis C-methylase UbiE